MFRKLYIVVVILLAIKSSNSIQINYVKVPAAIKNDTKRPVILDCNYSVRPDDTELVVKWFLNNEVVYQWIPPQKPQSLGILKDRVDLKYKASDDPKSVYRAVKIIKATHDIAGEYKCFVSTFADEDFSVKNMVVFAPEKFLEIEKTGFNDTHVNFTCYVSEAYPSPRLILYKDNRDDFYNRNRLHIVRMQKTFDPSGRVSVNAVGTISLNAIGPGTLVNCELRIPNTGYVRIKSLLYYPTVYFKDKGNSIKVSFLLLSISIINLNVL